MLNPTQAEIQVAKMLGIDYEGMNGPQIREAIRQRQVAQECSSIRDNKKYRSLVNAADLLEIPIYPTDRTNAIKRRIEDFLAATFAEKRIRPGTRIAFANGTYEGKEVTVSSIDIYWLDFTPILHIRVAGHYASSISAVHVALHGIVV